jgi:hypothetical protein
MYAMKYVNGMIMTFQAARHCSIYGYVSFGYLDLDWMVK